MPTLRFFKHNYQLVDLLLIGMVGLLTLAYWQGVAEVPFHPDESTYLFMSADWEDFLTHPAALAYRPENPGIRQNYRLLDPPLVRYLVGAARAAADFPALVSDWNWTLSWVENEQTGAMPVQDLLTAGRFGPAALFPFSLLLIYFSGWRLGGRFLGWSSMLLLATNSLVLLHTRRAMAEGGLVFSICLFIASLIFCRKRPWLISIPLALMVCAKHSTLPLAIIGLMAIFLYARKPIHWASLFAHFARFAGIFLVIFIILNPVFWAEPSLAVQAALQARQDLLTRQTAEFGLSQPEALSNTPWKAALSIVANLFITPPSIADVGNYLVETNASAERYLANPFQVLFRDMIFGGLMLALCLVGFFYAIRYALSPGSPQREPLLLLISGTLIQFLTLVFMVTLPFQRYVVPLIPFNCLWIGYCLFLLREKLKSPLKDREALSE